MRPGQSCLPLRYPPGDSVSAAGAAALPARLRAESKHRGRRQPPFFLFRQPVNRLPPFPSRSSAPSPASQPGSAREPLLPRLSRGSDTPSTGASLFVCLFRFSLEHPLSMPLLPSLPWATTQQHSTGGALPFIAVSSLPARPSSRGARPAHPAPRSPAAPLTLPAPPTPWAARIGAAPPPSSSPATTGGTFSGDSGPPGAGWCRPAPVTRPLPGRHRRQNRTCHRRHRPGAAAALHPPGRAALPPPPFLRLGSAGEGGVPPASCCAKPHCPRHGTGGLGSPPRRLPEERTGSAEAAPAARSGRAFPEAT